LVFKSSGGAGLIYANFVRAGFLLKFILNGKSKGSFPPIDKAIAIPKYNKSQMLCALGGDRFCFMPSVYFPQLKTEKIVPPA
jgi:hypothetical protein